jgi:hypothetical protein
MPMSPEGPRAQRLSLTALIALILAAAILPVVAVRGHYTFGPMTYELMRHTRSFVDGGGFAALLPPEPPGYRLLLAPLFSLGLDPMFAGAAVSWLAFVLSVILAFRILGWSLGPRLVLPAVALFLLQEKLLSYGTHAWAEGVHATSTLLALAIFAVIQRDGYHLPGPVWRKALLGTLFVLGIAAPFWLSFTGAVTTGSIAIALVLGAARTRDRAALRDCTLVAAGSMALAGWLMVHNLRTTGTLTGFPAGMRPTYHFLGALTAVIREVGLDGLGIPYRVSEKLSELSAPLWLGFSTLSLTWLCATVDRRPLSRLIAINVGASVLFISSLESVSRMDAVSSRLVYPLIPLITLLLLLLAARAFEAGPPTLGRRLSAGLAAGLLGISLLGGIYKVGKGAGVNHQERAFGYAPQTTRALLSLIRAATPDHPLHVAANRYGEQVLAHTSHLDLTVVPYDDFLNRDYSEAYGMHPWTEAEARAYFRQHHTEWFAFFYGPEHTDEYLAHHSYGAFVDRIHDGIPGSELSRTELPDGLLVHVDPSKW